VKTEKGLSNIRRPGRTQHSSVHSAVNEYCQPLRRYVPCGAGGICLLSGHLASMAEAFRGIPQFLQAYFRALTYIHPLTIPFSSL
jgi:hypothetical protein